MATTKANTGTLAKATGVTKSSKPVSKTKAAAKKKPATDDSEPMVGSGEAAPDPVPVVSRSPSKPEVARTKNAWDGHELVARSEVKFHNPRGNIESIICEVRRPGGKSHLKVVIGRSDDKSRNGISRQFFFEDCAHVMKALEQAYQSALPSYTELSMERIRGNMQRDMDRLKESVAANPQDWRNKLLEMEAEMNNADPVTGVDCD